MASIGRAAYPRCKRVVSAPELADAFTPNDVEWAQRCTQNTQGFPALLVRLKCYQWLGCFPRLAEVPDGGS
ncbi:hypothetical protein [Amycolatopsis sulphurea]|uniref:hypothetical protein n=1 Tax=Amycolatopsis sulphurea TaxID=76022 RepID=UPI001145B313|nr:hypothetical protein [Amycolatopsis sulphurea]